MDMLELLLPRRRGDTLQAVESEIAQEKASALGRTGSRLEEALQAFKEMRETIVDIERRLQQSDDAVEEADRLTEVHLRLMAELDALRKRVNLAYQFLIIQREAVGVRNHAEVERCYRVAESLR